MSTWGWNWHLYVRNAWREEFASDCVQSWVSELIFFGFGVCEVKMTLRQHFAWQRTTWQPCKYVRNYSWNSMWGASLTFVVAFRYNFKESRNTSNKYGCTPIIFPSFAWYNLLDKLHYPTQNWLAERRHCSSTLP